MQNLYLVFSDSAKYADFARNLVQSGVYGGLFSINSGYNFEQIGRDFFTSYGILPVMPFSIAVLFKIIGITDISVIATSFIYFLITLVFVFLLGKEIFKSKMIGTLSVLAVGFNYDLINYASSGASESPFIFEIIAGAYFISLKKKWGNLIAILFLILMYFTRPQAIIYISGLLVYYFFLNLRWKKAILCSIGMLILGVLVYFLFSEQAAVAVTQILPGIAVSDSLRGGMHSVGFLVLFKKLFYDLYNFYKLLPQIMNPYLFALFIIGIFKWTKDKMQISFKVAAVFMVLATFLVAAITIPFFRYIHPIVPLVYIVAVGTIVELISSFQTPVFIPKRIFVIFTSTFLILIFGVGQTLGIIFLDSRFEKNTHNVGKPPVYVELSYKLRDNTNKTDLVLTNLDTWGTWYGERKTIWFPLEPKQIIDPATGKIPFDAIYLTSYLIDDENYYMGKNWRMIFENPNNPEKWICDGCGEIVREFKLKGIYKVSANDDYEKEDANAILLIKKY